MASCPETELELPLSGKDTLLPALVPTLCVTICALGLATIWPTMINLWRVWTSDALESIGIFVPVVSFALIIRAWRRLDTACTGTWWGLALLLANTFLTIVLQHSMFLLVICRSWVTPMPPYCFPLFAYASGVVLLLGGSRLYRASLFPVFLLLFAKPVPNIFTRTVDLPLQALSAHIARAFAQHLGQPLTPDHLRLMFTPAFGMFIAPGCNGMRGGVTMALIALITGYLYRFRWYINALVVATAVLLGYLFNLIRLCALVLYYLVALHFTPLQHLARNADFVIGGTLFLIATMLLFSAVQRLRNTSSAPPPPASGHIFGPVIHPAHLAALVAVALLGIANAAQAYSTDANATVPRSLEQRFPEHLGGFTLVRTWNEKLLTGPVVYYWAEYAPASGLPVAIGISPALHWHDPILCHTLRDDHPVWQGPLTTRTATSQVSFNSALYADGVTQKLEASTQCSSGTCGEVATERLRFGLIYTPVDTGALLHASAYRSTPVLVRAETTDATLPMPIARQQLTVTLQSFLAAADLNELTRP